VSSLVVGTVKKKTNAGTLSTGSYTQRVFQIVVSNEKKTITSDGRQTIAKVVTTLTTWTIDRFEMDGGRLGSNKLGIAGALRAGFL